MLRPDAMSPTRPRPRPTDRRAAVRSIRLVAPEVVHLELAWSDDGGPLPFLAGQWVRATFPIPGAPETRSFSLSNPPSKAGGLELTILARRGSRFARFVTEELKKGDELGIRGPYGVFHLPEPLDHDPVFATESTGISAIRSMVLDLFEKGTDRRVDLLFGATHENEILFRREFEATPGLTTTWILRHPPEGWTGRTGTLAEAVRDLLARDPERRIWVSGFDSTVNRVNDVLADLAFPADRIEIERYE